MSGTSVDAVLVFLNADRGKLLGAKGSPEEGCSALQ